MKKLVFILLLLATSSPAPTIGDPFVLKSPREASIQEAAPMLRTVRLGWDPSAGATSYSVFYNKASMPLTNTVATTSTNVSIYVPRRTIYKAFAVARGDMIVSPPSETIQFKVK